MLTRYHVKCRYYGSCRNMVERVYKDKPATCFPCKREHQRFYDWKKRVKKQTDALVASRTAKKALRTAVKKLTQQKP